MWRIHDHQKSRTFITRNWCEMAGNIEIYKFIVFYKFIVLGTISIDYKSLLPSITNRYCHRLQSLLPSITNRCHHRYRCHFLIYKRHFHIWMLLILLILRRFHLREILLYRLGVIFLKYQMMEEVHP